MAASESTKRAERAVKAKRNESLAKTLMLERKLLKRKYGARFIGIVKSEAERLGVTVEQATRILCTDWLATVAMYLFSEPKDVEALMQARTFE